MKKPTQNDYKRRDRAIERWVSAMRLAPPYCIGEVFVPGKNVAHLIGKLRDLDVVQVHSRVVKGGLNLVTTRKDVPKGPRRDVLLSRVWHCVFGSNRGYAVSAKDVNVVLPGLGEGAVLFARAENGDGQELSVLYEAMLQRASVCETRKAVSDWVERFEGSGLLGSRFRLAVFSDDVSEHERLSGELGDENAVKAFLAPRDRTLLEFQNAHQAKRKKEEKRNE